MQLRHSSGAADGWPLSMMTLPTSDLYRWYKSSAKANGWPISQSSHSSMTWKPVLMSNKAALEMHPPFSNLLPLYISFTKKASALRRKAKVFRCFSTFLTLLLNLSMWCLSHWKVEVLLSHSTRDNFFLIKQHVRIKFLLGLVLHARVYLSHEQHWGRAAH